MKILYITTISNTVNAFLIPHIRMLIEQGHKVDVAFNITRPVSSELLELGCEIHEVPFSRSPLKKDNINAYTLIKKIVLEEKYNLVHTHTPVASAITRLACRNLKKVKIIYTAHGFHFFKGAPLKNWLIYYPIEKWLSKYTDTLITINKEDYERAKNKFKAKRVDYVPGVGLDIDKFTNVVVDREDKRKEIGVPEDAFVLLSVGELNKNKNHETIIKAIAKLHNSNIHYLICGQGPLEDYFKKMIEKLKLQNQVHLLGFRSDIDEICKTADVFAFPSKREGLGLAALEAMASGLPLITSNVHGIVDYSKNGETGFSCKPNDVDAYSKSIEVLINDENMRKTMGVFNSERVKEFDINKIKLAMQDIYSTIK